MGPSWSPSWDPRRGGSRAHGAEPCTCHRLRAGEQVPPPLGSPRPRLSPAPHPPGIRGCPLDAAAHLARALGNFLLRGLPKPSFAVLAPGSSRAAAAARGATPVSFRASGFGGRGPGERFPRRRSRCFPSGGAGRRWSQPGVGGCPLRVRAGALRGPQRNAPDGSERLASGNRDLGKGRGRRPGLLQRWLRSVAPRGPLLPGLPGPQQQRLPRFFLPDPRRSPRDPPSPRRRTRPGLSAGRLGSLSPPPEAVF